MLHLEHPIVDRLRAALPEGVRVMSAADLAGMQQAFQFTPAVHVIYQGYRVKETHADGMIAFVEQTWLTVAAVRNARDQKAGSAARVDSEAITAAIYQALAGWLPTGACEPMRLADAPAAGFDGVAFYLPLGWKTMIQLTKEIDDDWPRIKNVTADYGGYGVEEIPQ